jgi:hypothetical protein
MIESVDNGATFSGIQTFSADDIFNTRVYQDSQGRLWLIGWSGNAVKSRFSDDGGVTWSSTIYIGEASGGPDANPLLYESADGMYWAFWHDYYPAEADGEEVFFARSSNRGLTWTPRQQVTCADGRDRILSPAIFESNGYLNLALAKHAGGTIDIFIASRPMTARTVCEACVETPAIVPNPTTPDKTSSGRSDPGLGVVPNYLEIYLTFCDQIDFVPGDSAEVYIDLDGDGILGVEEQSPAVVMGTTNPTARDVLVRVFLRDDQIMTKTLVGIVAIAGKTIRDRSDRTIDYLEATSASMSLPESSTSCDCGGNGDVNHDLNLDPLDASYLIQRVYLGRDALYDYNATCPYPNGDINCDASTDPLDVSYLVSKVYLGQDALCKRCPE